MITMKNVQTLLLLWQMQQRQWIPWAVPVRLWEYLQHSDYLQQQPLQLSVPRQAAPTAAVKLHQVRKAPSFKKEANA